MFLWKLHIKLVRNNQIDTQMYVGDRIDKKFTFLTKPSAVSYTPKGQVDYMQIWSGCC